ncbi:MAG: hypothetical protein KAI85_16855 [Halopseudomonas aestusnigri]|nr:hypothetical protein [Halopseudomonas aestusnigri]
MSSTPKVVRSQLYWVVPPEDGQRLEDLDWVWTDTYDNGRMELRDEPPTAEEIAGVIEELTPYFNWDQNDIKHELK